MSFLTFNLTGEDAMAINELQKQTNTNIQEKAKGTPKC